MMYNKSQKTIRSIGASIGAIVTGFSIGLFVYGLILVPQVIPTVVSVVNAESLVATCSVTTVSDDTATWTATVSGGSGTVTYSWSGTDGLTDSTSTVTKTYATSGTKTGTVEIASGNSSSQATCSIVIAIPEPHVPQCSDGIDNDEDGLVDFPADIGCTDASDEDESNTPLSGTCSVNPTTASIGDTVTWTAIPAGGVAPYSYTWLGDDSLSGSAITATKSYTTSGTKTGSVTVTSGTESVAPMCTNSVVVSGPEISPQCSDKVDNDGDTFIDTDDPACHTDGDATNDSSYDASIDDENSIPVITLIGDVSISLTVGDSFTDPGATATDEEDGDITSSIVVAGNTVDTANAGTYTITYNVSDSKGAAADEVIRTVTVNSVPVVPPVTPPTCSGCGGGGGGGGTPIYLEITNESVKQIAPGTVLVTWDTNKQANSKVFYDLISNATSSLPFDEYSSSTDKTDVFVTGHSVEISGLESATTYYFRPAAFRSDEEKGGIELAITLSVGPTDNPMCEEYLFEHIRYGEDNNTVEVEKLQIFLNDFEGFNLDITGTYDISTFEAVEIFQDRYAGDILTPWGIEGNTGYVYITTKKKINEIYCNKSIAFSLDDITQEQRVEVEAFRTLLESLRARGIEVDTSKVGIRRTTPAFEIPTEFDTGLVFDTEDISDTAPSLSDIVLDETSKDEEVVVIEDGADSIASVISAVEAEDRDNAIIGFLRNINIGNFFRVLFHSVF